MQTPVKKVKLDTKSLPGKFSDCPPEDLISLVFDMFSRLIRHNDSIPQTLANTTRFHSRTAPGISIKDYIESKKKSLAPLNIVLRH